MSDMLEIEGPAGSLEARVDTLDNPAGWAVLCHPHPQFGGNMHDAVLDVLAQQMLGAGRCVLRFNFRGTGSSAGSHDNGQGEVDDVLAACRWAEQADGGASLWLGGYSFGAAMVWRACQRGTSAERALLVAPPVGRMPFEPPTPALPIDLFAGDQDEFIDPDALAALEGVRTHTISNANHFFMGVWADLARQIQQAIS